MREVSWYVECDDCAFCIGSVPQGAATAADTVMGIRLHLEETGHQEFGILVIPKKGEGQ